MKCHICGSSMRSVITDLPFKIHEKNIVIIKNIPVFQCDGCIEYLLDDSVMQRVEQIMATVYTAAELEVVRFAA